ncbi:MAG: GFA family protein [Moraxella sp.]|nr:GFA family protein [Moraxella sp.]
MKGQCLCQAVGIETVDNHELHACHCGNCRTWGGSANFSFLSQGVNTDDGDKIAHYQSSDWGERAFCKTCGTHLYFHQLGTDNYYVSAGLFDDVAFKLVSQIFIDKKACYYELANDTPKLTESEFLAMVAGES